MKKILTFLLIFCLLFTSCVKIEGGTKDTSNPGGAQSSGAAEAGAQDNPGDATQTVQAEPFALYPAYLQMPLGQHVMLDADTAPASTKLTWTSSNPSAATVDENGRVTPVAEGEAVITASLADNAGVISTCGVLVVAEGNIYLWEYPLEPEDIDAIKAAMDAQPDAG